MGGNIDLLDNENDKGTSQVTFDNLLSMDLLHGKLEFCKL